MYRGNISNELKNLREKKTMQFVDWCPTGFRVAKADDPPVTVPGGDFSAHPQTVCCMHVWQPNLRGLSLLENP